MRYVTCNLCGSDDYVIQHSHYNDKYCKPDIEVRSVICKLCGLVYINPQIDQNELVTLYSDTYAGTRSGLPGKGYLVGKDVSAEYRSKWIGKHVGDGNGRKVLDIGCAAGNLLNAFRKRGWDVYGIEPTRHYAEFARKNYGLNVSSEFLEDVDFPESSFDLVILTQVLEHFSDPTIALMRIGKLLKKDGFLHIDVPNIMNPNKLRLSNYFISTHLFSFSPITLSLLLSKTGFQTIARDEKTHIYMLAANTKGTPKHIDFSVQGQSYKEVMTSLMLIRRLIPQVSFQVKRVITNTILSISGPSRGWEILKLMAHYKNVLLSILSGGKNK